MPQAGSVKEPHKPLNLASPWESSTAWQEANRSIDIHIHRYRAELRPTVAIARETHCRLASIFSFLTVSEIKKGREQLEVEFIRIIS